MGQFDSTAKINLSGSSALICDSNATEQDVLAAMLGGFGINKITRISSTDDLLRQTGRPFDLIFVGVTAINLEAMDGIRSMRRDPSHPSRTTPVVVMSSFTPETMVEGARGVGASFVIAKPLSAKTVFDRILWLASVTREFVETETYFGPDRRTRNFGPPIGQSGRRSGDLSAEVGLATGANMSQDAIDDLMKPAKLML